MMVYLSMLESEQDKQTFEQLYTEHRAVALRVAMRVCSMNQALAEDAVHDAFMRIIDDWDDFINRPRNNWRSLIVTIAKNRAIDLMRKDAKNVGFEAESSESNEDFTAIFEKRESHEYLASCIAKLPEKYRVVLELRYFHDLSNPEIAKYLGITTNNVAVRISRAIALFAGIVKKGDFYDESER